jgi:hypothetical protein
MKRHLIILVLTCVTSLGFSQKDKFASAVFALQDLDYFVTNKEADTINYHISTDKSKFWINDRIETCNKQPRTENKLKAINLATLTTIKYITVKSKNQIEPKTYASAELMELEFQDMQTAIDNEKIINELDLMAKECVSKAPWICWRIENKLYFIVTRATLFGQEIPKIKEKMNEKLK